MSTFEEIASRVDAQLPDTRAELESLVRIPSVSSPSFDQSQVRRSAEAVAALARQRGLDAEVIELVTSAGEEGRPAVLAHRQAAPGKPTVLLYAHHDVQPQGSLAGWAQDDPFEPVERDGRLYGRGTADDKAGVMVHMGALAALGDTGLGVTLYVEGEEEVGSPTFRAFLETYRDRLRADVIVVADSSNWKVGVPSLTTSLRGVVDVTVRVDVLDHALHSGAYGGPILDAPTLMTRLLATLHGDDGSVAVSGLVSYDAAAVEYTEETLRSDAGLLDGVQLAGHGTIASRLWTQPAISLIGMDITSCAEASNTLIPSCTARLSLRIAPGDDPERAGRALVEHLEAHAPFGARVVATVTETGPAFKAADETPTSTAAREALRRAWQTEPVDIGVGGSIPFIADLAEVFPKAEILVTGIEDPDTRAHSHNESLHLDDWRRAIVAEATLLARLGGDLAS
ncbi:dipeptidase [Actinobaculum sp. 313]|uniref:dipeptidase n=1 Tax=Actinobaculum sp. 313 TaxID=2495645 RepID=UPI000D5265E8|nr:dipeptidase [Actinobaculum sp. 313]AWE42537.1 dipeptidase [Actinobaculum sp. 313]